MGNSAFFLKIEQHIKSLNFIISYKNFNRPWGCFLLIDGTQAQQFLDQFFKGLDVNTLKVWGKLSPKILIVKPKARLSAQYHNWRAEIWQDTDANHPSDEYDIIRVKDDFVR